MRNNSTEDLAEPTTANELFLWWLGDPRHKRLIGTLRLFADSGRVSNGVSLEYGEAWLASGFALSEDLPLREGEAFPMERDSAVGAVDDARPDRWGERVIRHLIRPPRLSTLDYLYFAGDQRFGALGVSRDSLVYEPYASEALPTLGEAPEIFKLVRAIENGDFIAENVKRLISPGATLGGARPKALVSIDGVPWIIKFAEYGDTWDSPLIEHATMTLAGLAGVDRCETRIVKFKRGSVGQHALLVKRFDRDGLFRRHAVSAKVALSAAGSSYGYPELALLLRRRGDAMAIERNSIQIFRRMVFNVLIDNTDDHEKNHVLLMSASGLYELAPAFDVLPSGLGLGYQQMRLGKHGSESTIENALSELSSFRLPGSTALSVCAEVAEAVNGWKEHFERMGIAKKDIESLATYLDGPKLKAQRRRF